MAFVAAIPAAISIASTVLAGLSGISKAKSEKKAAKNDEAQAAREASLARATSQRDAIEEQRQGRLARSRAKAVAAASGAGVSDPTVIDRFADLEAEGAYGAASRLFEGESGALGYLDYGASRRREARARSRAYGLETAATVLSGVQSFQSKYR